MIGAAGLARESAASWSDERLVAECLAFARQAGYTEIVLWTNDILAAARRIYQRAGFELVESGRHHSFGHDLVGQNWRLPLG